jgi:hypothetical protein
MKNMLKQLLPSSSKRLRDKIVEQKYANAHFRQDLSSTSEQGCDFLSAKAPLGQLIPFNGVCLHAHCHVALFFSLDLLIHVHVSSTKARESDLLCESVLSWAGRHIGKVT